MRAQQKHAQASDKIASVPVPIPLELYREACQDEDGNRYTRRSFRISARRAMRSRTEPRCALSTTACLRSCRRGEPSPDANNDGA